MTFESGYETHLSEIHRSHLREVPDGFRDGSSELVVVEIQLFELGQLPNGFWDGSSQLVVEER